MRRNQNRKGTPIMKTMLATQDLIATIANDRDDIATFYARAEFVRRCATDWRVYAPAKPRTTIDGVAWHNFHEK
jgi:hypothetical protein